jgi:HAD superfamily hydrolase (TIGR01509 family)
MPRSGHHAAAPPLGAVTFDMDGLLVDSEPVWFQAESAVMERLHGTWARGDQDALVGGSMTATVAYLLNKGTLAVEPATVAGWLLDAMIDLLRTTPAPVLPGALELVAEVQSAGVPYALVTSSEPEVVDAVLAKLDVEFPVIVCAADVSHAKPDPEGYLLAAAKLGVEPEHTIALEDSVNGVLAAEAAGYRTVAVPSVVPVPQRAGRIVLPTLAGVTLEQLATRTGLVL